MKTLSLSEVKMKLSQFVEEVSETTNPISVTRNGQSVAVLMSQELYDGWKETLHIMQDPKFLESVLRGIHLLDRGEGISLTAGELLENRSENYKKPPQPVRIKIHPETKTVINDFHPQIQSKIYESLLRIAGKQESGTLLKDRLDGLALSHIGDYRIIYRWRMHAIEIIAIDVRETAYQGTVNS